VKATKKFKPTTFEGYLLADSVIVSSVARVMINHREGVTTKMLVDEAGINKTSVDYVLRQMRADGFVYISNWFRTENNGSAAVYSLGKGKDVVKNRGKPKNKRMTMPSQYVNKKQQESDKSNKENLQSIQMIALNKALVPVRNMSQQRVANLRYLNHIQGIR
jgi:hypothetical protein